MESSPPPSRWRPFLWCVGAAGVVVACGVAIILAVRGDTPLLRAEKLEESFELWRRNAPTDYDLRFTVQADRMDEEEYAATIRAGKVVRLTRNGDDLPNPNDRYSIDGIFDDMREELKMASLSPASPEYQPGQREGASVKATFDATLGIPRLFKVIAPAGRSFVRKVREIQVPGKGRIYP